MALIREIVSSPPMLEDFSQRHIAEAYSHYGLASQIPQRRDFSDFSFNWRCQGASWHRILPAFLLTTVRLFLQRMLGAPSVEDTQYQVYG